MEQEIKIMIKRQDEKTYYRYIKCCIYSILRIHKKIHRLPRKLKKEIYKFTIDEHGLLTFNTGAKINKSTKRLIRFYLNALHSYEIKQKAVELSNLRKKLDKFRKDMDQLLEESDKITGVDEKLNFILLKGEL